jgi:hypothetical protein
LFFTTTTPKLGRRSEVYVGTAAIGCPSSAARPLFIPI